jgi:hypothetical protein
MVHVVEVEIDVCGLVVHFLSQTDLRPSVNIYDYDWRWLSLSFSMVNRMDGCGVGCVRNL